MPKTSTHKQYHEKHPTATASTALGTELWCNSFRKERRPSSTSPCVRSYSTGPHYYTRTTHSMPTIVKTMPSPATTQSSSSGSSSECNISNNIDAFLSRAATATSVPDAIGSSNHAGDISQLILTAPTNERSTTPDVGRCPTQATTSHDRSDVLVPFPCGSNTVWGQHSCTWLPRNTLAFHFSNQRRMVQMSVSANASKRQPRKALPITSRSTTKQDVERKRRRNKLRELERNRFAPKHSEAAVVVVTPAPCTSSTVATTTRPNGTIRPPRHSGSHQPLADDPRITPHQDACASSCKYHQLTAVSLLLLRRNNATRPPS